MKAVNLLPHEELASRSIGVRDPLLFGGVTLATVVVVGMAGGFLLEHSQSGSTQHELTAAQQQLAEAQAHEQHQQHPSSHAKLLPLPSVTSQEQPWRTAVASAMSTRIAFDRLLQEFGQVVPSDVTVSDLTMGAPGASAASGTSTTSASTSTNGVFSLTGTTFSEDSVARLLSRLMLLPDLTNVSLTNSTADQSGVVTFEIAAQVKGAGSSTTSASSSSSTSTTTTSTGPSA